MNVYVGYDTRLDIVYNVCKHSIQRHSNAKVFPLIQQELRNSKIYDRPIDMLGSTEFTLTRFLVPYLNNFNGWALYCDCDFLFTINVEEVFNKVNNNYAVMVVQHDYTIKNTIKMDGKMNHVLPRKNWSSFILYNCSHPSNNILNTEYVNTVSPSTLHQFRWLTDDLIGNLGIEYNWLVGYYKEHTELQPKILHYTDGGPWFNDYKNVEYNELWNKELELYKCSF